VRQDVLCGLADREVVFLGPAFLQAYDVGGWVEGGDLAADFCEARIAVFGDEFEAPAIEGEDAEVGGEVENVVVGGLRCSCCGFHCGGSVWVCEVPMGW
jgi:hypothetical protein